MITCKISKIEERTDAEFKNNKPVGYLKIGEANDKPKINECFFVGTLKTSLVQEILAYNLIKTLNSLYKLDYLEITGLFVDSDSEENIKNFYRASGLYEIEGKQYIVGRIESEGVIPSNEEAWLNRPKKVFEISELMLNWSKASSVISKDLKREYEVGETIWATWKDQVIAVSGIFEGYSK